MKIAGRKTAAITSPCCTKLGYTLNLMPDGLALVRLINFGSRAKLLRASTVSGAHLGKRLLVTKMKIPQNGPAILHLTG
jgi:hypothetical protein